MEERAGWKIVVIVISNLVVPHKKWCRRIACLTDGLPDARARADLITYMLQVFK